MFTGLVILGMGFNTGWVLPHALRILKKSAVRPILFPGFTLFRVSAANQCSFLHASLHKLTEDVC